MHKVLGKQNPADLFIKRLGEGTNVRHTKMLGYEYIEGRTEEAPKLHITSRVKYQEAHCNKDYKEWKWLDVVNRFPKQIAKTIAVQTLDHLEEKALMIAIAADWSSGSATSYSFINGGACRSDSAESSEDELGRVLNDNFSSHYLVGRGGIDHHVSLPRGAKLLIHEFIKYLSTLQMEGIVDVVEIFGGEGGVAKFPRPGEIGPGSKF